MSSGVELSVRAPGANAAELAPPDLSQSPQVSLEQWSSVATNPGADAPTLAWGCVAADVSVWSGDASELAQNKLAEIASGTAARMRGRPTPMHLVLQSPTNLARALVADDGLGAQSRTFLAFSRDPDRLHACFVTCTDLSCASAVEHAELTGPIAPPPSEGIVLRSLSLAVHHPHGALATLGGALFIGAAIAIATRPGRSSRRSRFPR